MERKEKIIKPEWMFRAHLQSFINEIIDVLCIDDEIKVYLKRKLKDEIVG